jgi:hypothetical protein
MPVFTDPHAFQVPADMGKRRQDAEPSGRGRPPIGKQVNVRIPPELLADLELIETATGNDLSAVIRQILSENVAPYVRRSRDALRERQQARGSDQEEAG